MLKECEGCMRQKNECKIIIEQDPHFRSLNCPCFECLVKITCVTRCGKQSEYLWRRVCISYDRLEKIATNNSLAESLVRTSI